MFGDKNDHLNNKRIMFICCELLVHVSIIILVYFEAVQHIGSCYDNHVIHCSHYYLCRFFCSLFIFISHLVYIAFVAFFQPLSTNMLTNYSSAVINNRFPYETYFIPCFMTCIRLNNHKEIRTRLLSPLNEKLENTCFGTQMMINCS